MRWRRSSLALPHCSFSRRLRDAPPAPRSAAVAGALAGIEHSLTSTKYQHRIAVDARKGIYRWDCSIMAAWILERTAPAARRALGADKPLARDFVRAIRRAHRPARPRLAALTDVAALAPGDLFAWLKPEMFKQRANTGHVGFAIGKPWRHPRFDGVWLLRIADATTELQRRLAPARRRGRLRHRDDRVPGRRVRRAPRVRLVRRGAGSRDVRPDRDLLGRVFR